MLQNDRKGETDAEQNDRSAFEAGRDDRRNERAGEACGWRRLFLLQYDGTGRVRGGQSDPGALRYPCTRSCGGVLREGEQRRGRSGGRPFAESKGNRSGCRLSGWASEDRGRQNQSTACPGAGDIYPGSCAGQVHLAGDPGGSRSAGGCHLRHRIPRRISGWGSDSGGRDQWIPGAGLCTGYSQWPPWKQWGL